MFGLISIISATAVILSLTAPEVCKFAELSKGLCTNFNWLLSNGPNDPSVWPGGVMSPVSQGQTCNVASSEWCDANSADYPAVITIFTLYYVTI